MCIYLVISFSCCCYLFLSFYMCSPFLSLLYVSICFHLSEWVTSGPIDQSDQSRWKPPFWGVREECGCPHLQWAQCISANCSIYDFQFQWQGRGRRSVRRGGRRLTPLALPVPYTPHLGIASIKTGPKHASIWRGPKMPQSKRGQKQPESWREGVADFSISRRDLRHWLKEAPSEVTACSNGIGDIISFTEISRTGVSEASPKGRPLTLLILLIQSLITYHYEGPSIETKSEHL